MPATKWNSNHHCHLPVVSSLTWNFRLPLRTPALLVLTIVVHADSQLCLPCFFSITDGTSISWLHYRCAQCRNLTVTSSVCRMLSSVDNCCTVDQDRANLVPVCCQFIVLVAQPLLEQESSHPCLAVETIDHWKDTHPQKHFGNYSSNCASNKRSSCLLGEHQACSFFIFILEKLCLPHQAPPSCVVKKN